MHKKLIHQLAQQISASLSKPIEIKSFESMGGGCINQAAILHCTNEDYFIKYNQASLLDMFEAEATGLDEIAASATIRVPKPIGTGVSGQFSFLVLEALSFNSRAGSMTLLAEQLAAMHRVQQPRFGWQRANFIGSTPQSNQWTDDWVSLWQQQRLGYQLNLLEASASDRGLLQSGYKLMEELGTFFTDYQPLPSLLHGDLWSGNYSFAVGGVPVIYDPAVYYGDREADIAMTELFGGFSPDFYSAYQACYPLDAGYSVRKTLYNLYHILNHVNLFGGAYVSQARQMIDSLLSELRG
ncbi:MAG: fructosamine kinase family protein [Gammaproteobacteria bacterium]|nr:fructosamine kinase family protein [Gammaproteobacteria bacterium]